MAEDKSTDERDFLAGAEAQGVREIPALALVLLGQSARNTSESFRQLYENERRMRLRAEAAVELIQDRIARAVTGPHMPTSHYLLKLLYPLSEEVDAYLREHPEPYS